MLLQNLTQFADENQNNSLATRLRKKRFCLFKSFVEENYKKAQPSCLKIIDVGGTPVIWQNNLSVLETALPDTNFEVTVVNIKKFKTTRANIKSLLVDAKDMRQFRDKEFDIVFSNSLLEHVGDRHAQLLVAKEMLRVGKRYFVQTPNFYFPIEPHFLFPFFQFLPQQLKVWLVTNFALGWRKKLSDCQSATKLVNSVKLLRKNQLLELFPGTNLFAEKFMGLTKSFIVYGESQPS